MSKYYVYRYIRLDTNTPFYVGKGKGKRYLDKVARNNYFKRIVQKYPHEVEIMLSNLNEDTAFQKEKEFIKLYKDLGYCEANITDGAGGMSGISPSKETREKISKSMTASDHPKKWKAGTAHPFYGKKDSIETRLKKSESRKGHKNPSFGRKGELSFGRGNTGSKNPMFGKTGELNPKSIKVVDIVNGYVWGSIAEAERAYCMTSNTLRSKLSGRKNNNTNLRYLYGQESK